MYFTSDNCAGAHPQIMDYLQKHSAGFHPSYAQGPLDQKIKNQFNEIFEREVAVFFVATGTAANCLALSSPPTTGGVIFCHETGHILNDECGAPYFFSQQKIQPISGENGKISLEAFTNTRNDYFPISVHHGRPTALSLSQATELGTLYSLSELEQLSQLAHENGLLMHMDGARFANALVGLQTSPAEMTWKRGIDIVSFGGSKNGCWCAEAIVFMDPEKSQHMPFLQKQAAQLFSKNRFVAAQFEGYFHNHLWLDLAKHANQMATKLANIFRENSPFTLAVPTQANEVFVYLSLADVNFLKQNHVEFSFKKLNPQTSLWRDNKVLARFVTSYATTEQDLEQFKNCLVQMNEETR